MHRYCTYFDHRFLDRGMAMIRSLQHFDPGCQIVVLCLTASCEQALLRVSLPDVKLIRLQDFEKDNPDVLSIKTTRSLRDYYFTLSGCLAASALQDASPDEVITYLDADLFFYASPEPLFAAMSDASVGLVAHRHHWWARRLEKYGRFNVGWVSFRRDPVGMAAALWWRERCIEWCYCAADGDRFADQKYLDHMFVKFPKVVEIAAPGANLGPWNICRHSIKAGPQGTFIVDGKFPLIFFHYSAVTRTAHDIYLCSNISYLGPFSRLVRNRLYKPYLAGLKRIREELGLQDQVEPDERGGLPLRRRLLAPLLSTVGRFAGHYVRLS